MENQATDRCIVSVRTGTLCVQTHYKRNLEEVIDAIIKRKVDLAEKSISNDEMLFTEMTNEELKEVLTLRL